MEMNVVNGDEVLYLNPIGIKGLLEGISLLC